MCAHESNAIPKMIPTVVLTARSLAGLKRWQGNVASQRRAACIALAYRSLPSESFAGSLPNTARRNPCTLSDGLKQGLDVLSR